jgi:hypothetical protein
VQVNATPDALLRLMHVSAFAKSNREICLISTIIDVISDDMLHGLRLQIREIKLHLNARTTFISESRDKRYIKSESLNSLG